MLLPPRAPPPWLPVAIPGPGLWRRAAAAGSGGGGGRYPGLPCSMHGGAKGSAILEAEPKAPRSRGARRLEVAAPAWIREESAAPGPARLGSE